VFLAPVSQPSTRIPHLRKLHVFEDARLGAIIQLEQDISRFEEALKEQANPSPRGRVPD